MHIWPGLLNTHIYTCSFMEEGKLVWRELSGQRFHVATWGSCTPHRESDKLGKSAKPPKDSTHISPQPPPQLPLLARAQPEGKATAVPCAPSPHYWAQESGPGLKESESRGGKSPDSLKREVLVSQGNQASDKALAQNPSRPREGRH